MSEIVKSYSFMSVMGLVAQWIRRLPTEQKIPGSSPGEFGKYFNKDVNEQMLTQVL